MADRLLWRVGARDGRGGVKTIVSLTPLAVLSDSRTYKQATSFARLGYRSIVVEMARSAPDGPLPFELSSPSGPVPGAAAVTPSGRGLARRLLRAARAARLPAPAGAIVRMGFAMLLDRRFRRAARGRVPQADLYILHSFELLGAIDDAAQGRAAPIVYDAHDFYSEMEPVRPASVEARWIRPWIRWREAACIARAAETLTVSEGLADLIEKTYARRPIVLRNTHFRAMDRGGVTGVKARLGLPEDTLLVVCVGQRKPGSATDAILHALAMTSPNTHLAFLGRGYDDIRETAPEIVRPRVHAFAPVPADEVVPFISDADAAVITYTPRSDNYRFALPNRLFQSLAAGLPLVTLRLPEMDRLLAPFGCHIAIDMPEAAAIAAALKTLESDPNTRRDLAAAAARAADALDWERQEPLLAEIVERALLSGPSFVA